MCCTVTLSDSSVAPGDSPTEEETDSASRFQPGKDRTHLRPLHKPQWSGGRAERWGPSPFIPAPSSAGIQQVDSPIPTLPLPHSEKLALAGLREDRNRQELFTTLAAREAGLCLGLNFCSYSAFHAFLGNGTWRTPALFGLFSWLLSLRRELGEFIL